jgi:hypothetical protein
MKEMIAGLGTGIIFFAVGSAALFRAKEMQRWGVAYYARNKELAKLNPFLGYMKSNTYVIVTRIIGLVCIVTAMLIICVLIRAWIK